jgi:hypothetical protein
MIKNKLINLTSALSLGVATLTTGCTPGVTGTTSAPYDSRPNLKPNKELSEFTDSSCKNIKEVKEKMRSTMAKFAIVPNEFENRKKGPGRSSALEMGGNNLTYDLKTQPMTHRFSDPKANGRSRGISARINKQVISAPKTTSINNILTVRSNKKLFPFNLRSVHYFKSGQEPKTPQEFQKKLAVNKLQPLREDWLVNGHQLDNVCK